MGGELQRGRQRSSRRAPAQVAFMAGGAGGKPQRRSKRVAALLLVARWAAALVLVARWAAAQVQAGGGAGG